MFRNFISSGIGAIHLLAAFLAMVGGAFVLFKQKGTTLHRRAGYFYLFSMIVLNATAFMMYRLFGKFGIFHILAVVSLLTLTAGMLPVLLKKPIKSWASLHYNFMYWSVVGLYAAFAAEFLVRVPQTPFFSMVGIATTIVMAIGCAGFIFNKKRWDKISNAFENRQDRVTHSEKQETA